MIEQSTNMLHQNKELETFLRKYYHLCKECNMYLFPDSVGNLHIYSRNNHTRLGRYVLCTSKSVMYSNTKNEYINVDINFTDN